MEQVRGMRVGSGQERQTTPTAVECLAMPRPQMAAHKRSFNHALTILNVLVHTLDDWAHICICTRRGSPLLEAGLSSVLILQCCLSQRNTTFTRYSFCCLSISSGTIVFTCISTTGITTSTHLLTLHLRNPFNLGTV